MLVAEYEQKPGKSKKPKREKVAPYGKEFEKKANRAAYQVQPADVQETIFRHSAWRVKRALVRLGLVESGTSSHGLETFDECGAAAVVEFCRETNKYRVVGNTCKNRHCEPCQRAKANLLAANLRGKLEQKAKGRYRFVTLTLKHNEAPLREQIDRIYDCFKSLRKSQCWKSTQVGGAAILEIKWNPKDFHGNDTKACWHVHLHVITEGGFLAQQTLSDAWQAATGDSYMVDIRALNEGKDAAHYVAKYVSKGTNDEVWTDPNARQEWILAMKGTRTAATYGSWRGFALLGKIADKQEWTRIGTLTYIASQAQAGEPWAIGALQAINLDCKYDPHKKRKTATNDSP